MEMANKNIMLPRINIPYWVSASVQGALLAATRNDNADKPQNVSIDPAHALASSLAVAASRVMLNYISRRPKIHFELAKLETERLNEIFGGNRINQVEETGNGGEDSGRWKPKPKPTATCKLGLGKDWGCCGNYKGCCYLWHEVCWYHDAACFNCGHYILCGGPFCQPG